MHGYSGNMSKNFKRLEEEFKESERLEREEDNDNRSESLQAKKDLFFSYPEKELMVELEDRTVAASSTPGMFTIYSWQKSGSSSELSYHISFFKNYFIVLLESMVMDRSINLKLLASELKKDSKWRYILSELEEKMKDTQRYYELNKELVNS